MSEDGEPLVVLGTRMRPEVIDWIGRHFSVIVPDGPLDPMAVPAGAERARVLVTLGVLPTGATLMDALPQLGLIACYATGYEGVDLAAAAARGICVSHNPAVNSSSVADLAMALLLATTRRIVINDAFVRAGRWRVHPSPELATEPGLTGARLGIFGLGQVGLKIAARAIAFEMEVAYHGRAARHDSSYPFYASLRELAEWADVLMVATRATPDTHHAVDADVLHALGPRGHLVNIARGSIVDQHALMEALEDNTIAGAGLDVFDGEPAVPKRLRAMQNVVLSPHTAGNTESAQHALQALLLENINAFLRTGRPLTPVPAQAGSDPG